MINVNYDPEVNEDSARLFKELVSDGVSMGIMNENSTPTNKPMPQNNSFQYQQPQMYEYQMPQQQAYDPMSEFESVGTEPQSAYLVEQVGEGANTRYNVKDSRTGQIYANCMLKEAADKIESLMNEGKMFSDIEVMKCIMTDAKFAKSINEMRQIKTNIEMAINESVKAPLKQKLNEMKMEAIKIKNSI